MSKTKELIINSLEYYDRNSEKNRRIFQKIKYYSYERSQSDVEHNSIIFYDKNKKEIYRSRYEIIGTYYSTQKLWTWSWSVPNFDKNSVYISRKILNYGLDIPPLKEDLFMKAELITSRFKITNEVQLDIHIAIASYISKKPMIYKIVENLGKKFNEPIIPVMEEEKDYKIYYLFLLDDKDINKLEGED